MSADWPNAGQTYKDTNGLQYRVVTLAFLTGAKVEPHTMLCVVYECIGDGTRWVRPLSEFLELLESNVRRFTRVEGT